MWVEKLENFVENFSLFKLTQNWHKKKITTTTTTTKFERKIDQQKLTNHSLKFPSIIFSSNWLELSETKVSIKIDSEIDSEICRQVDYNWVKLSKKKELKLTKKNSWISFIFLLEYFWQKIFFFHWVDQSSLLVSQSKDIKTVVERKTKNSLQNREINQRELDDWLKQDTISLVVKWWKETVLSLVNWGKTVLVFSQL